MLPILWRAEAQADLAAIIEYIAEHNPQSALDLYNDIERVVSQLAQHPYLYRLGGYLVHANSLPTPTTSSYIASA
jgi:toxin ParE1/3/4